MNKKTGILIEDELLDVYKQVQAQYASNIEYKFRLYNGSLSKISSNTVIINTLYDFELRELENAYTKGTVITKEVGNFLRLESHEELSNCMIYSEVTEVPVYGRKVTTTSAVVYESWYSYYIDRQNDNFFINPQNGTLSLIQDIIYEDVTNLSHKKLGFVKLDVVTDKLFAPAFEEYTTGHYYDIVVTDSIKNIVYSSAPEYRILFEENSDVDFFQTTGEDVTYYGNSICLYSDLNQVDMNVYFFFDVGQLATKKIDFQKTLVPIIIITLFIIIAASYLFSKSFTNRISVLVNKMQKAEMGDMVVTQFIEGKDEIAKLDGHFNHMVYELDKMIQKNYIQELEKKEVQLRNLQLQINPHFLYNTLETIGAIAAINNVFEITELTEKLGDIFRYSLGNNQKEFVTVKQELLYTQNYIYIQKVRFGDKFKVHYNVEKSVNQRTILRFVLQPLVENAINHGLGKKEGKGTLMISIYEDVERLVIEIKDDGVGMSQEQINYLTDHIDKMNSEAEKKKMGIGIQNVNQRIKLTYGFEYGIKIKSTLHQGSCFVIRLPLQ